MGLIFNIYIFLNKVVVGPVNSAQCLHSVICVHEQCGVTVHALKKKRKKRRRLKCRCKTCCVSAIQTAP